MNLGRWVAGRAGRVRAVVGLVLAWGVVWVVWGTADVLSRRADVVAAREPYTWRLPSREVAQLRSLLSREGSRLPAGAAVVVEGAAGRVSDGSQLVLWAQYLAPELNFYWRHNVPAGVSPSYRLRWNLRGREPEWARIGRRGPFVLERRREPG